jgi:photosystem I P700 chlorophyll a apoprotein A2
MPPYPYTSFVSSVSAYVNHQFLASLLVFGSAVHFSIFLIRDYTQSKKLLNNIAFVLTAKGFVISILSWLTLFLGFHILGLYSHNDAVVSFGDSESVILIEPLIHIFVSQTFGAYSLNLT